MARNQLLAILIVVATATFAIGAAIENSDEVSEPGEPHVEAAESEGEAAEAEPVSEDDETLLGIDAESAPLVAERRPRRSRRSGRSAAPRRRRAGVLTLALETRLTRSDTTSPARP